MSEIFEQRRAFVQQVLGQSVHQSLTRPVQAEAEAPVNIALCKYWGKRDPVLNLPVNSSLSVSLPGFGTRTRLHWTPDPQTKGLQRLSLNRQPLKPEDPMFQRLAQFLALFPSAEQGHFEIETHNSVPTGAGLASSASGFAALVKAMNQAFDWQLSSKNCSLLARIGSGSACRSLYSGFSLWQQGVRDDGLDSYAIALPQTWPSLCVGLVEVDTSQKPIGSTAGMQQTVSDCDLYQAWPKQAQKALSTLQLALETQDFVTFGKTAEHNALNMHATMIATWPPILYWQPESVQAMQTVWKLREEGVDVYFTMDAGPNLKLLFEQTDTARIQQAFGDLRILQPFNQP
ncbi:MAG: diphosphomevalonate decarboxylase [Hydrogenovibrio sp.]|uniref:diphosphomevalonate decarboxylase n=1 Tax=Hydrogenovibrio sp. TaxID=2065821 RepID=UPI00286FF412|nr:diphosphomevalonate decarboxylase [Hydrogenovibrio sp.]MDR9498483.1 diphosphomevalonate decarboxylase [Hydrogenovibrio sp.]